MVTLVAMAEEPRADGAALDRDSELDPGELVRRSARLALMAMARGHAKALPAIPSPPNRMSKRIFLWVGMLSGLFATANPSAWRIQPRVMF